MKTAMIDDVIKKYENYISNVKWHIDYNLSDLIKNEAERNECIERISVYKEFISDLTKIK